MNIDGRHLRNLRVERGWSRQEFAELVRVSERQIARIESASTPVKIRETTRKRLREVLGDDIESTAERGCSEEEPAFHGAALIAHRTKKGLSRQQLAELSGVSIRQIERLENAGGAASPRPTTVTRLARALQVKREAFSLPPSTAGMSELHGVWKKRRMQSQVSAQVGIAYDLVCRRYGVSEKAIVELAPLLFTLLAEGSLMWRARLLEEMSSALKTSEALQSRNPHLWFGFLDDRHDWGMSAERESIERRDLLGRLASKDVADDYNHKLEKDITPFLNYLRGLADEIGDQGVVDLSRISDTRGLDWFASTPLDAGCKVCEEEFERLTGGSEEAKLALQEGAVSLADIPEELLTDESTESRIAWLEAKLSPKVRNAMREQRVYDAWMESLTTPANSLDQGELS